MWELLQLKRLSLSRFGGIILGPLMILLLVSSCGDGGGGGNNGTTAVSKDNFTYLWENVFEVSCVTACHEPFGEGVVLTEPRPLDLSTKEIAYASLVNVENTIGDFCGPNFDESCGLRVEPFNPDDSWLIQKLEGTNPAVLTGDQMPQDELALDQETIDLVRQWISNGALND